MNAELRAAIYNIARTATGLTGGLWYYEAPQKTAEPYAVYSFVSNPFSRDSASKFEEYYLQINIYADTATASESVKESMTALLDDSEASFTLTSWYFERIERQFCNARKFEDVWMVSIQYKIELTKK